MRADTFRAAVLTLADHAETEANETREGSWERVAAWLTLIGYGMICELAHTGGEMLQNFTLP